MGRQTGETTGDKDWYISKFCQSLLVLKVDKGRELSPGFNF